LSCPAGKTPVSAGGTSNANVFLRGLDLIGTQATVQLELYDWARASSTWAATAWVMCANS
jgi:hypothetical protein